MQRKEGERYMEKTLTRPPIGVKPRRINDLERIRNLFGAVERYMEASTNIPDEWLDEIYDILFNYVAENGS